MQRLTEAPMLKLDENDTRFKIHVWMPYHLLPPAMHKMIVACFELNFNDERYLPFEGSRSYQRLANKLCQKKITILISLLCLTSFYM